MSVERERACLLVALSDMPISPNICSMRSSRYDAKYTEEQPTAAPEESKEEERIGRTTHCDHKCGDETGHVMTITKDMFFFFLC